MSHICGEDQRRHHQYLLTPRDSCGTASMARAKNVQVQVHWGCKHKIVAWGRSVFCPHPRALFAVGMVSTCFLCPSLHARFRVYFSFSVNNWSDTTASYYSSVGVVTYWYYDAETGPTFAVAIMAFILGLVGAIAVLVLRARATTDQDGPFRKCMPNATGANTGTPAGPTEYPAVGTV